MTHDVCGPGTIGVFKREFGPQAKVWDRRKVVIIPDHYIFTQDSLSIYVDIRGSLPTSSICPISTTCQRHDSNTRNDAATLSYASCRS